MLLKKLLKVFAHLDEYIYTHVYKLKHCRKCYTEIRHRKEWAKEKYSTRQSQVLYFILTTF